MPDYAPPVRQLLTRDKPDWDADWKQYADLGLGSEHIPELIRMATDRELLEWAGQGPEGWAPFHAAFALGELRTVEAIEPLLDLYEQGESSAEQYGVLDVVEDVLERIGPAGIPTLTTELAENTSGWARNAVAGVLGGLPEKHPEVRQQWIDILTRQLEKAAEAEADLNAFIISALLDLKAVETMPVIERAYATGQVDDTIVGRLEDVQYELGLRDKPPPRRNVIEPFPAFGPLERVRKTKAEAKARKAKRKQAEKSKMRNRKRK